MPNMGTKRAQCKAAVECLMILFTVRLTHNTRSCIYTAHLVLYSKGSWNEVMPVPLNDNNTADQYMYICGGLTVCRCVMCGSMVYILYTVLCSLFKVYTCHQIFSSDVLVPFSRLLLLPKHLNWMFLGKCEPFNKEHEGSAWPLT